MSVESGFLKVGDYKIIDEVRTGNLVAQRITDTLAWGEGTIQPIPEYQNIESERELIQVVLESIEPVAEDQLAYSMCTDGRVPLRLLDGSSVPVREQIVGTDSTTGLYIAESLGNRFYKDPSAPTEERVEAVFNHLKANRIACCGHIACGAAGGFSTVSANVPRFAKNELFEARTELLLPKGVYDVDLRALMHQGNLRRAEAEAYADLDAQMLLDAAKAKSGKVAIAELNDDGRGVHGHVEELVVRVKPRGFAINEAKVAARTGGREVFGVNDGRMDHLAEVFSRGNDVDYKIARMAAEDFANAGHGTLAKDLPTWIVTKLA
jgi:hypothetical protein